MKILFLEWPCYGANNWIAELIKQGYDVDNMKVSSISDEEDFDFQNKLSAIILEKNYDVLCSFNFFPVISIIAKKVCKKYIAWVYDSPSLHMHSIEINNSCNYVFIFDKCKYQEFIDRGIKTVYYLPLAGVSEMKDILNAKTNSDYCSDITFVGSLYRRNNFYDQINYLPEKIKGYLEGIMESQRKIYGYYMIPELLYDDILNEIKRYVTLDLGEGFFVDDREVFASMFLAKKIANKERESMLIKLAEYFEVDLYSDENFVSKNIKNHGSVPYGVEMYRLFHNSKININSTLRCIRTGINLRTMDILSAGGFCITNYQEELSEHFDIGKEIIVYESELDLIEKTAYYLKHEDTRKEIAHKGRERIIKSHNYENRIREMMNIVLN